MGTGRCEIIVAKSAGFCFGVKRAVDTVYKTLENSDSVYTLGPVVHNKRVIDDLEKKGVKIIDKPECAPVGSTIVIRAHGIKKQVLRDIETLRIDYKDATCPIVRKIQKAVDDKLREGYRILIAGDKNHPEIIGIVNGFIEESHIFKDEKELNDLIESHPELINMPVFVVSQTTFNVQEWEKCVRKIKMVYTKAIIFDTICGATEEKQKEANELSQKCDLMVVIGSPNSSNTVKLKEVCLKNCPAYLIESAQDVLDIDFSGCSRVGITAGASTPDSLIKEVFDFMSDLLKENEEVTKEEFSAAESEEEISFEQALEESLKSMNTDQQIKGVIVGIAPNEIQVDIERKHAGYIPYNEYSFDPNIDPGKDAKIGDVIDVIIMKTNDAEGTVMLSKKRVDASKAWDDIISANENGTVIDGTVTDIIKGGVLVSTLGGIRVFIPASLATASKNDPLEDMLNQKVSFKVIEVNRHKRRIVGSIKSVLIDSRKEAQKAFWETVQVGDTYTGVVKSMTSYGAFVSIAGGVDGMIHISELSWNRIKHPSEVLSIGDTVEVYIKSLDDNKISLGYKKTQDNPWEILKGKHSVGDVITSKIVGMTSFGAFAQVVPGLDGLIHISQLADRYVEKPQEVLSVGEEVTVKITEIDYDKKRISLSVRALIEPKLPDEDSEQPVIDDTQVKADKEPSEQKQPEEIKEDTPVDAILQEAEAVQDTINEEKAEEEQSETNSEQ